MSNKSITQQSYEATAQEFTHHVAELAPIDSIEKFIRLLPFNAKIIDIGCGSGRDAKIFTDKGIAVLGIDFCVNLIKIAKEHAPLAKFELMDIENIILPDASFDGIWAVCSLGHIAKNNLPSVLKKLYQLLANKGYFYLALKKGKGEQLEHDIRYKGNIRKFWAYYEEEELKNILRYASFKILDFSTVPKNHAYQNQDAFRVVCQKK
jgi:SAM-dependent methyltransferase